MMNEVLQFLKENPIFYIATVDGDTPKVRPFGFVMEYDGKLCFCTNNQKNVYRQLKTNPKFEISTTSKDGKWLRLKGKAVFITNRESKKAALDASPSERHEILLNVRALGDPGSLRATVEREFSALPARLEWQHLECFRPAPPVPFHRA